MDKTSSIETKLNALTAPAAKQVDKEIVIHEDTRIDPFYWLNQREDQEVIGYLSAENDYLKAAMSETEALQDKLFDEIVGRIKQDDESVPYVKNGFQYYTRYQEGKEYPLYCRKSVSVDGEEEVMLDQNELAQGNDYYSIRDVEVSPNNKIAAFGEDTLSRRIYTLRFKDLEAGNYLDDVIPNTEGYAVWSADNRYVFYSQKDETLRSNKIFRHEMGTDPARDVEIWHETDPTFSTYIYKTKSEDFLVIGSYSTLTNHYQLLPADQPTSRFKDFTERRRGHEYNIYHDGEKFYIRSNDDAQNFKLMSTPDDATDRVNWEEVIASRSDVLLEDIDIFSNYLLVHERNKGITKLRVQPRNGEEYYVDFGEDAYQFYTTNNYEFDTDKVRLRYTSLKTPWTTYDYDMQNESFEQLKQQEVVGGYDPEEYVTERIFAKSRDGVDIPLSVVYKKGFEKDGNAPFLLYAYGSYGYTLDPYFSSVRLSLLDRGFGYAIAHIRGGQAMGRQWYEDGKLLKKKNTFNDFVDCSKYLIEQGYTSPDHLYAMGGSAGGLLMGAVVNQAPELYRGVIAAVPFVDVVTTMLDESIPLTTGEFDEWGNPKDKEYYDYILSYSPYDQVSAQDYPAMLVTTGLHDSQVQYWEPAKWVAKLRTVKTDSNPLLLYTNMSTGHGGASGRFERHKETAMEYAFFLDLEGIKE